MRCIAESTAVNASTLLFRHSAARGSDGVVRATALVEFVDIMPTLIDLAGLAMPDVCPTDASKVKLCREGASLKPVIAAPATTKEWRPAAFMQYAP
jgi:arylsulfatase A-like enzyme